MYHSKGQHQFWTGRDRMDVQRFRKYTNVQRDEIWEKAGLTEREEAVFLKMKRNESATIVSVAMDLHCSESTINADIKEIKRKIKEI